ncbi:hypothetical protein WN55_05512 [Dufourea novaeangliae]|uniref:RNase H type-1 domain-containing protein n=1 Tax=Dufourea novaeangliae TaxID=178035 RepID=A0A154PMU8_DUFNO|nr:hypothetical protein WN55_05512 [Dufourea novaeangliae]
MSVGSACICPELNINKKRSINHSASVFTAECIALNDAFDITLEHQGHRFLIFSDSLSTLQALQSPKIDVKINSYILDIKKKYNQFHCNSNNRSINLYWIPSHTGIQGNEDVDQAAKSATYSDSIAIPHIPYTDLYEKIKKRAKLKTNEILKNQGLTKGKKYFQKFYNGNSTPWFAHKNLSREFIVTINRIRADHYNLAASLNRVGIVNDSKCKCNYEYENLNHVIWQCERYNSHRPKLITALHKLGFQLPLDVDAFTTTPNITACLCIFSFPKDCNLYI